MAQSIIEGYILHILDRPHSIFHLPTLRTSIRAGTLPPALRYGARFHRDHKISCLAKRFLEEAKAQLQADLEHVSLENVQACILLASLSAASQQPSSESLYLGIAIHMAEVLQLGECQEKDPTQIRELKRRIWCSLYMADFWCSTGNGLNRKMASFGRLTDLPTDEAAFHGSTALGSGEDSASGPGLWAYMITLVEIFGEIQELSLRAAPSLPDNQSMHVDEQVGLLGQALTSWEANLPEHIRYSKANLLAFRAQGLGGPFVALHQGYYHYRMLLYYQYLDTKRATTEKTARFSKFCQYSALAHSDLLAFAREIGECDVLYAGVGHSTVISSSVLLHTAMFGESDEIIPAQKALQANFEVLQELSRYWPSLDLTIRRLSQFQLRCTEGDAIRAYDFDEWMVAFLLRYHLTLDEKRSRGVTKNDIALFPVC
ncbi:unnamed protein product [Clonostachys rosea f. rosea IK726]|uniref:Uncharacterized protein n=1 Tax=Clonostachys rosea f. rosea IK726 TaxID=1349383 RepID=A0ACA9TG38_BIOOC|nr:unnamed protein product [Clonostachys rosea f. rosea IK726]